MKRVGIVLVALVALIAVGYGRAGAADVKIGFVDLQKVLNESETGKKAKKKLEDFIKSKQGAIDDKSKVIEQKKADFEKKGPGLSDSARKKEEEELNKLVREFKRVAGEAQEEVGKKEVELTKDVLKNIRDIVVAIGKDDGYTAILEGSTVLYSNGSADLTEKVIKKYNSSSGE